MVEFVKPPELSEDLIDLRTKAGAAGRATNRLRRRVVRDRILQLAEESMMRELEAQLKRVRASRGH